MLRTSAFRFGLRLNQFSIPLRSQVRRYASSGDDVFTTTTNSNYIEQMYEAYKQDPNSVHASWRAYFNNMDAGVTPGAAFQAPPHTGSLSGSVQSTIAPTGKESGMNKEVQNHLKAQMLVRAYQVRGHFHAKLDPLNLNSGSKLSEETGFPRLPDELTPEYYNWNTKEDLEQEITLGPGILPRFGEGKRVKIKDLIAYLEKTYCSSYGIQYMHIPSRKMCDWIRSKVETPEPFKYNKAEKKNILDRLMWATIFEQFLETKFPNDKRFGLEGGESLVPGLKFMIDRLAMDGIEDIFMGMPHRGRLNVLSNVVRKPNESIFAEFNGSATFDEGSGDVKYHLGMNYQRPTNTGGNINLSLVANPSHLEAEDPVVMGLTYAAQNSKNANNATDKSIGILMHGDAAVEGQGVVYETMGFHTLRHYGTGGTIHVIVNNQIGFTTDPSNSRSTPYPSDFAKTMDAPVFHVNGEDMEACVFIFDLAAQWRATFKRDVIIDMFCFRKYGHNEIDQPSFTQPMMYKIIGQKKPTLEYYKKQLLEEGVMTEQEIKEHHEWIWGLFEEAFKKAKSTESKDIEQWVASEWRDFKTTKELATEILPHEPTNITEATFKEVGTAVSSWPENFKVHKILQRILKAREKSITTGTQVDMATAEALALGSLAKEGFEIRVSGQDVERGTFSQRHAVLHDQDNGSTYVPLQSLVQNKRKVTISNSHLSEYGVFGFEYGYSLHDPRSLIMWEAQFGDFANTAQVISDQFVAGGERKWNQRTGLVVSLPHGYDGQGPEHSSARIERYLQLADEDSRVFPSEEKLNRQHQDANMAVVYPTTPANLFHVLRRQMHREFRKPLILIWSKSLLRHPLARSNKEDFVEGKFFRRVIDDPEVEDKTNIKRLILCSGQVFATLFKAREENEIKDTAIVRLEQLHPFPWQKLKDVVNSYPNLTDFVWTQEEPMNAGAYSYVSPRLETLFKETNYPDAHVRYAGRNPSAAVAAGVKRVHIAQEKAFIKQALELE
ncbi:alpha-ketoglutarate dehydrogenase [Starmerella bacillaris]|uniref:2-oxoglutarate dehydrogenase, mitochondrial n=1 Tax=Starmerella bacillaris TaxID=1247836 RepID=A0AAV5RKU7_STABA|nr:alpha-ketoglutarate dehydrogenase [Starmerella bacillaris]